MTNQPPPIDPPCPHQWDDASTDAGGMVRCRRCRVVTASIDVIEEQAEEIERLRARAEAELAEALTNLSRGWVAASEAEEERSHAQALAESRGRTIEEIREALATGPGSRNVSEMLAAAHHALATAPPQRPEAAGEAGSEK